MVKLYKKNQPQFLLTIILVLIGISLFTSQAMAEVCTNWSSNIENVDLEDENSLPDTIKECQDQATGTADIFSWEYVQENSYCYDVANGTDYCCPPNPSICCGWHKTGCGNSCSATAMEQTCEPAGCTGGNCIAGSTQCLENYSDCTGSLILPPNPTLTAPSVISPSGGAQIYAGRIELKWSNTGAWFYKYHIQTEGQIKVEKTVSSCCSETVYGLDGGDYSWAACSCSDSIGTNCICGNLANFTLTPAPEGLFGGLVPCGRKYDNPNTSYVNESEICGVRHVFLLFKNILDFILWRLSLIILVILVIITAVIYYFSWGTAEKIIQIRAMWRAAGTGFAIMLLAWTAINILLALLGYQVEFFGKWWKTSF